MSFVRGALVCIAAISAWITPKGLCPIAEGLSRRAGTTLGKGDPQHTIYPEGVASPRWTQPFQGCQVITWLNPRVVPARGDNPWAVRRNPFGVNTSARDADRPTFADLQRFEYVEPHMGTRFRIVLYAADEATAKKAARAAFARIAQLDQVMSDYKEDSELMRLCKQAGGGPIKVSDELFDILCKSQDLANRSEGAFDVTVGPVVRLWRRARRQKQLPEPKRLAEALALVGDDKMVLDEKEKTVRLLKPGMLLDLGGIAKGYAVDQAQKVLKQHGVRSALVAGGGDIAVSDPPPGSEGWPIGIAPLDDPNKPPTRTIVLKNAAVSTSGDAEQHVEIDGKRYSHIVDPKTGIGLTGRISVTVVAPNGTLSDSLATAVSVLGPDKGLKLVEATEGVAALIVQAADQGSLTLRSKRWPASSRERKPGS